MIGDGLIGRFWRPRAIATVLAPLIVIFILAAIDRQRSTLFYGVEAQWREVVHYGIIVLNTILAVYTVRVFIAALSGALDDYLGLGRARSIATFVSIALYGVIFLLALEGAGQSLSGLLVGGALTGVIIGIAGQASLSNIIAGLVILFARPYTAGMYLTARAGSFGGVEYSGQVWDVSLFYTTLHSGGQEIRIPNSAMIAAVVVVRPQELDVSLLLTMPLTVDLPPLLERLRHDLAACVTDARVPLVKLQGITEVGYIVAVRVFVASEEEQQAVETVAAETVWAARREIEASLPQDEGEQAPASVHPD